MSIDDLPAGLTRLAPDLDVAAARAALDSKARPRLPLLLAGVGLVVIALAGTLLAVRSPTPSSKEVTTVGSSQPVSATASDHGVEVTVELRESRVAVGERVTAVMTVRNVGLEDVSYFPSCGTLGSIRLDPSGDAPGTESSADYWDGRTPLAEQLDRTPVASKWEFGAGGSGCTLALEIERLSPNESASVVATTDLRGSVGELVDVELVGEFHAFRSDEPPGPGSFTVVARAAVDLEDDPARAGSSQRAIEAFAADGRLAQYLETTSGDPKAPQKWTTSLTWWRGAWELRVVPYFGVQMLRMRYDPTNSTISDVRIVDAYGVPSDDPNAPADPPGPPDTILH